MQIASLREQLEKAHENLTEVIDEVVFSEESRKKVEDDLINCKLQFAEQERKLLKCIDLLVDFIYTLGTQVILPSSDTELPKNVLEKQEVLLEELPFNLAWKIRTVGSIDRTRSQCSVPFSKLIVQYSDCLSSLMSESLSVVDTYQTELYRRCGELFKISSQEQELYLLRAQVQSLMANLPSETPLWKKEMISVSDNSLRFLKHLENRLSSLPKAKSLEEEYLLKVKNLEIELQSKHKTLEKLQQELNEKKESPVVKDSIHVIKLLQKEVSELRSANDSQRVLYTNEVNRLKGRCEILESKLISQDSCQSPSESLAQRDYLAKIKAFEMTIHTLNLELSQIESRSAVSESKHLSEIQSLNMELQLERKDRRCERDEYDTMLNRVTMEIERLMKENVDLKQRIRNGSGDQS